MSKYFISKSILLLSLLAILSVIQYILFHLSTGTILFLLLTIITALHIILKKLKNRYPRKLIKILSSIYRAGLFAIGIISIIILFLMIHPIKTCRQLNAQTALQASHMIVLGAGLNGDQVSERLKLRLDKAMETLELNREITVIVSGGQGSDELISEAEAMKRYLIEAGIEEKRILLEDKSTSTYENLLYSKAIIDKLKPPENVLIVTSDFHIFRSQFIAKKIGWNTQVLCSKSELHVLSNYMIREIPAIINDFLKTRFL